MPRIVSMQFSQPFNGHSEDPDSAGVSKDPPPGKSGVSWVCWWHSVHDNLKVCEFCWPQVFEVVDCGFDDVLEFVASTNSGPSQWAQKVSGVMTV